MRNGRLRHKMTLQEPVDVQDSTTGAMVRTWQDIAPVWASLEPLSAREFVAAGAEQSEVSARVTIRYREGVTSKMRLVYRGLAYDIKGVLADPKSGLEYLTLPVGEGVRYEDPAPPVPISCSITLTGDIAALLGASPMTVSGQTASCEQVASELYAASTDYEDMTQPPSAGIAVVETELLVTGTMVATAVLGDPLAGNYIIVTNSSNLQYEAAEYVGGVRQGTVYTDTVGSQVLALGYGSDGTLYLYVDGVQVSTGAVVMPSGAYLSATGFNGSPGDTSSVTFRTSEYQVVYLAGTLDWCGNEI